MYDDAARVKCQKLKMPFAVLQSLVGLSAMCVGVCVCVFEGLHCQEIIKGMFKKKILQAEKYIKVS